MTTTIKKKTQGERVLETLKNADGNWVNGRVFLHEMYISQFHRVIHDLEEDGVEIEHSDFRDEYGFVSYRIIRDKLF